MSRIKYWSTARIQLAIEDSDNIDILEELQATLWGRQQRVDAKALEQELEQRERAINSAD